MKTQFDHKVRIVSLANLCAMCERISGVSHVYQVSKVSRSRVHVTYSNPDEYGNPEPITAVFPCYPSTFEGHDNPAIVLDCVRIIGGRDEYDPIQKFWNLIECPTLWRLGAETNDWQSHAEIRAAGNDRRQGMPDTCTVCDLKEE